MSKSLSSLAVRHQVATDAIRENTADHGVDIDGVLLKDATVSTSRLQIPTNATVGYVLKCEGANGNAVWAPGQGVGGDDVVPMAVQTENINTTPYTVSPSSTASSLLVTPTDSPITVVLPPIGLPRILTVRNLSTNQPVLLVSDQDIWVSGNKSLTIPPDSYAQLEAAGDRWLSC